MKQCRFCYKELILGKEHYCVCDEKLEAKIKLQSDLNSFAGILKNARLSKKLTLEVAAKNLGMSIQYISQIENGVQLTNYENIEKLSNFYNLDAKKLAELKFKSTKEYKEYTKFIEGK